MKTLQYHKHYQESLRHSINGKSGKSPVVRESFTDAIVSRKLSYDFHSGQESVGFGKWWLSSFSPLFIKLNLSGGEGVED